MNIQVEFYPLHVSEEEKQKTHVWGVANVVAEGVHIMNIRAINYRMENGEWGHFFSYPQIKVGDQYQGVVKLSRAQKVEIETEILNKVKESILQEIPEMQVTSVTIVEKSRPLVAVASIKVNQIQIDHVRLFLKDGQYFLKMPQYQKNGEWKPLVQIENSQFTIPEIQRYVKEAYEEKVGERAAKQAEEREKRERQLESQVRGKTIC